MVDFYVVGFNKIKKLGVGSGEHKIVVSISNTLGNMLNTTCVPSGLTSVPYITEGK